MTKKRRILIIEDDPSFAKLLERHLDKVSVTIDHVDNGTEGLSRIKSDLPEVVLLDLNLPDSNGMDILKNLEKENIPSEIIIITAHGNVNVAVEAMQYGAFDFLEKPFSSERLTVSVKNAMDHHRLTGIVEELEELNRGSFQQFIGRSNSMQVVYNIIENAAPSRLQYLYSVKVVLAKSYVRRQFTKSVNAMKDRSLYLIALLFQRIWPRVRYLDMSKGLLPVLLKTGKAQCQAPVMELCFLMK